MLNHMQDLYESEFENEFEFEDDQESGYGDGEFEFEFESEFEAEGPFDEAEEMELAAELLTVGSDEEMEYFLGNLLSKAVKGVKTFAKSKVGRAVGGLLKNVAKKALPIAGAALGNLVVPGAGGLVGGKLASMAGRAFGLELEGLSPEDQEFEVARRFVRLAGATAQDASRKSSAGPPKVVAKNALVSATKQHAPGLVKAATRDQTGGSSSRRGSGTQSSAGRNSMSRGQSGQWVRRGRRIVLLGA